MTRLACCRVSKRCRCTHCSFSVRDHALHHAVLLGRVRRDELLAQAVAANQCGVAATGEDQAVVRAKQEGAAARVPSVPKRAISACSRAASAVFDFPLRDRCQPSSSRLWQSMTRASTAQPSRPLQTRHRSVAQRSFGAAATEGMACTRGRKPTGRFFTCHRFSWKTAVPCSC